MTVKAEIALIPWDPESPAHTERLYRQRIACGWNEDAVESWRDLQRAGQMAIQWIILSDSDVSKDDKIIQHLKLWPSESTPIADTAISFGGKPRNPKPASMLIPIGHISLDAGGTDAYKIASFYVSVALQGHGIGRAAMDLVEAMAIEEPFCAKTLFLSTACNEYYKEKERWEAFGQEPPPFTNQDWYARRGYEVYDRKENMWFDKDPTGKKWWVTAVFMRKVIGQPSRSEEPNASL